MPISLKNKKKAWNSWLLTVRIEFKAKFSKKRIGIVASEKKKSQSKRVHTYIDFFYDIEFATKAERLQIPSYVFS